MSTALGHLRTRGTNDGATQDDEGKKRNEDKVEEEVAEEKNEVNGGKDEGMELLYSSGTLHCYWAKVNLINMNRSSLDMRPRRKMPPHPPKNKKNQQSNIMCYNTTQYKIHEGSIQLHHHQISMICPSQISLKQFTDSTFFLKMCETDTEKTLECNPYNNKNVNRTNVFISACYKDK